MARRGSLILRLQTRLGLALIGAFLPALAVGQPASLLLDINQTTYRYPPAKGNLHNLQSAGNRLYFAASSTAEAAEAWVSDGTPAGTESLCPGRCDLQPFFLGGLGRLMLWTAGSSTDQRQLWRSDGTRPGTFALTEPDLGIAEYFFTQPRHAFLGRSFYFVGCTGSGAASDCDLWRTDGTVAGTRIFQEAPRSFFWLHAAGDRLYYLAADSQGTALWVTNGTAAGTLRLRGFSGESQDLPREPVSLGRRLFFFARTAGDEIWTSDGTAAGTRPVTNFEADTPFGWLKPIGNRVYFLAFDTTHAREIWRTDGTPAGTVRVTDFVAGDPFPYEDGPSFLWEVGGIAIFKATDFQGPFGVWTSRGNPASTAPLACGNEDCPVAAHSRLAQSGGKVFFLTTRGYSDPRGLWVTDGTDAGTRKLRDLCSVESCDIGSFLPWKGGVLFTVEIFSGDKQIWFSDGTAAGTRPYTQITGAVPLDDPLEIAEIGGDLYFFAEGETQGLWVRTAQGQTRPVRTLATPGPASEPRLLDSIGNRLFFTAQDGLDLDTPALWSSLGTPETTGPANLPDIAWDQASDPVRAAGLLFFQVGPTFQPQDLWRTDGTPQGTFVVAHLQRPAILVPFQGSLYFFDGQEIWKTDGTVAGTVKTGDLPADLDVVEIAAPGPNGIYLKTVTAPYKSEFWITDGTTAGTSRFTDFNLPGVTGWDPQFTSLGSHVYFSWEGGLWKTDGTLAGTTVLKELPIGEFVTKLTAHQGALYFFTTGFSSDRGLQLWRTDGTAAGTVELGRFAFMDTFQFPLKLTPFAGKLYFNIDDGVHGIELWVTDGTPAGTTLVRDILPGARSSVTQQLTVAGGRLFFTATDQLHGFELWQSDGTAAGTRMVQDILPQAGSSAPTQLTVAGDKLFFTADDGVTGREVWVLPLAGPIACQPSSTRLCLNGGRYAVEATWRDFQGHRGVGHAETLTADTGYFWFFDPANVETVLKVLDGRGVNSHVWVFYGALSNVEYTLTVTDTQTGLARRYFNPSGVLASVGDTFAFGPLGASSQSIATSVVTSKAQPSPLALVERRIVPAAATGTCAPSSTRLCLNEARFAVEIAWKDFSGNQGTGKAVELTDDTGWFWFFDATNVEVVIKVLDGTSFNGHHWVFYGALSSVEYSVTVTDTQTGEIKTYRNPSGRLASIADTEAF